MLAPCFTLWAIRSMTVVCAMLGTGAPAHASADTQPLSRGREEIVGTVLPAVPNALFARRGGRGGGCRARIAAGSVALANDYLAVTISPQSALVVGIQNKLTGERYNLATDQVGFALSLEHGEKRVWSSSDGAGMHWTISRDASSSESQVRFTTQPAAAGDLTISVIYTLKRDWFWVERRLVVESPAAAMRLDRLVYGRADIPAGGLNTLDLGRFDRPRLISKQEGGCFAGVGWWFYSVDKNGTYENREMNYAAGNRFEGEPWYLGVFRREAGEPFAGWLWYKNYLQIRKAEWDKQSAWTCWNVGWGEWGIDVNDPRLPEVVALARSLGVNGLALGSGAEGLGVPKYIELARSDPATQRNLATLAHAGIAPGVLFHGTGWDTEAKLEAKLRQLDEYHSLGYRAYHFDFFDAGEDSYTVHRNVARFFRAARAQLDYTECHLGMSAYGPQFQREVLVNHPADLEGFDLGRFSADWTTFCGFRQSRSQWQKRYQYLMPESGLYYFTTHYANWGHPKRYTDPEPQQFLYGPHAYTAIGYNFQDAIGYRESLVASAAFSPFASFGYLDLHMPERDIAFTREYRKWVEENIAVLRPARVCMEDASACVVGKIADGRGVVFLINYTPGRKTFRLRFQLGLSGRVRIQQVYPERATDNQEIKDNGEIAVAVRGESVAILNVNHGLASLPPANPRAFPIDITEWKTTESGPVGEFFLPDVHAASSGREPADLPKELVSLEQVRHGRPDLLDVAPGNVRGATVVVVDWIGRGALPERFLKLYGFRDGQRVETWKFAPWAYADRLWLVYRPAKPVPLRGSLPRLSVNGEPILLVPRVDYRPKSVEAWACPLFFADVTEVCRFGESNQVRFMNLNEPAPATCYLTSAAS